MPLIEGTSSDDTIEGTDNIPWVERAVSRKIQQDGETTQNSVAGMTAQEYLEIDDPWITMPDVGVLPEWESLPRQDNFSSYTVESDEILQTRFYSTSYSDFTNYGEIWSLYADLGYLPIIYERFDTVTNYGTMVQLHTGTRENSYILSGIINEFINEGTITSIGNTTQNTYLMRNSSRYGTVDNRGTLQVWEQSGLAIAIGTKGGDIINSGLIRADGGLHAWAIRVQDTLSFGTTRHGTLDNSGQIIANSNSANSYAVYFGSSAEVTNSGEITATSQLDDSVGIRFHDNMLEIGESSLENAGLISADYAVLNARSINNSGTITGNVTHTEYNDTLTNTGTITGDISLGEGNDLFDSSTGNIIGLVLGEEGSDTLIGSSGSDTLNGGKQADFLDGGKGADSLDGGWGQDTLEGGDGNDFLSGNIGNDTIFGGTGNDTLSGGSENDTFVFQTGHGDDIITDFNLSNDSLDLTETAAGFTNAEEVLAAATDTEEGLLIDLSGGDSLLLSDISADDISRINLVDWDTGSNDDNDDIIDSPDGDIVLRGTVGNDFLSGGSGNDQIWAGSDDVGNDTLYGGAGADTLAGGAGDDYIAGDEGNDTLYGGAGDDEMYGDVPDGFGSNIGEFNNTMWAGPGDDFVQGSDGNDVIGGGDGNDTLTGRGGNDTIYGGQDGEAGVANDAIFGDDGDDVIYAGAGNDGVYGGAGNDNLFSGAGYDVVEGGTGDDTLWGGGDNDRFWGGTGADVFYFGGNSGDDSIHDFNVDEDQLILSDTPTDFTSHADITAAASDTDNGLLIDLGGGNSLLLEGLSSSDINDINITF